MKKRTLICSILILTAFLNANIFVKAETIPLKIISIQEKTISKGYKVTDCINIKWGKYLDATHYAIMRSDNKNGSYKSIAMCSGSVTEYNDKNVIPLKTYFYKIKAFKQVESDGEITFAEIGNSSTIYQGRINHKLKAPRISVKLKKKKITFTFKNVSGTKIFAKYKDFKGKKWKKLPALTMKAKKRVQKRIVRRKFYLKFRVSKTIDGKKCYSQWTKTIKIF